MERRVDGSLGKIERASALSLDSVDDRIAMRVARFERGQDDGIQMSFEHFGRHLVTLPLALLGVNIYLVYRGIVIQGKWEFEMDGRMPNPQFEGWRLFGLAMTVVTALSAILLVVNGLAVGGVHLVVRATAWTSFALFVLAFSAAAMATLLPNGFSHWQRRNRRFLGLSFAFSHLVHAVAIMAYVRMAPDLFWQDRTPLGNIPGLVGYVFIALMAATSFDATARFVGPRLWKLIHSIGIWVIWFDFVAASAKRIPQSSGYAVPVAIALAALGLRAVAAWHRRKKAANAVR
jgi:methionine sulfoxide reductase heme-binding subunit